MNCRGVELPPYDRGVLDMVTGQLQHANGLVSAFCISDVGTSSYASKWLIQAADGRTAAAVTAHGTRLYVGDETEPRVVDTTSPHAVGTLQTMSRFIQAIRSGTSPVADINAGVAAARVVDAAQRSLAAAGVLVSVDADGGPEAVSR